MSVSVNTCFFSLCVPLCFFYCMVRSIRSNMGCAFWSSRTRLISCRNCIGWSTKACASLSGRSRTIAISIAPPSFWKRAGRPSWSLSRIATALFSHSVRSHSSNARRVRAAFWSGTCSRFGLPRVCTKRLLGGLAWCRFCSSLLFHSLSSFLVLCPLPCSSCVAACSGY